MKKQKKRKYKVHTKKLKEWAFVADMFGPMKVWSLQHPMKDAMDAYSIDPYGKQDFIKVLDELACINYFDIYLNVEIKYEKRSPGKAQGRWITQMKFDDGIIFANEIPYSEPYDGWLK